MRFGNQTITHWQAQTAPDPRDDLDEGKAYAVRAFTSCSYQPASGSNLTSFGLENQRAQGAYALCVIPAAGEHIKFQSGTDFIAEGDYTDTPDPPKEARRVMGVKDFAAFRLAHYEILAG